MFPTRFELISSEPESDILSVELREQLLGKDIIKESRAKSQDSRLLFSVDLPALDSQSHVESKVHNIAVLYDIGFALYRQFAGIFNGAF